MKSRGDLWVILLPDEGLDVGFRQKRWTGVGLSPVRLALQCLWERVPPARTVVVSTPRDRLQEISVSLPADNHLRLPCDRGSGVSVLVALLWILERDPQACVLVLAAEEAVCRIGTLHEALRAAVAPLAKSPQKIVLVGEAPAPSGNAHGWILPQLGTSLDTTREVAVFWEHPGSGNARRLQLHGALTRTTIMAAVGSSLLSVYGFCVPHLVAALHEIHAAPWWSKHRGVPMDQLARTAPCDLWQEVLQQAFDCLSLVAVGEGREAGLAGYHGVPSALSAELPSLDP